MSIKPLHNRHSPPGLPERGPLGKANGKSFDSLLDRLQTGGAESRIKGGRAVAELLRMELMRNSLSLAATDEVPSPHVNPLLAEIIAECGADGSAAPETRPDAVLPDQVRADVVRPSGESLPGADVDGIGRTASRFLGTPYRFGGSGPSGIDCSSFVQQVFREHQVDLPRTAREQIRMGTDVAQGELRKGDLVFFRTYASYPSHVGIYLGDGKMIHASSVRGKVVVSDMNSDYYRSRFLGAKRVA